MVMRPLQFMKTTDNKPVIVTVAPATVSRYSEASEEVEQRLGASPGPEFPHEPGGRARGRTRAC